MGVTAKVTAEYIEAKTCSNKEWTIVKFLASERFKGSDVKPAYPNVSCVIPTEKFVDETFVKGESYELDVDLQVQPANGSYPAKINYSLLGSRIAYVTS